MPRSFATRIKAIEKSLGSSKQRREFTLEQLILASRGIDPGPPAAILKDGEQSIEHFLGLVRCVPERPEQRRLTEER